MNIMKIMKSAAKAASRATRSRQVRELRRAKRGTIGVMVAVTVPVMVAFGAVALDGANYSYRNLLLRQTTQAAGLAAANKLTAYYTSGNSSSTAVVTAAQTFAASNMATARYGTVLPANNVVLGNWDATTSTFTSLASSGGISPDAVKVIGINTATNGNALPLFFGGMFGRPSIDLTVTAIASYGTGQTFNTIIVNDLSQSFSSQMSNQIAADLAILNCVKTASSSASQFGITAITGHAGIIQALSQANANYSTIRSSINSLGSCGSTGNSHIPACSGSNVAAGIYSAIQQFSGSAFANTKKNVVIITDGVPNASTTTYATADGIYPTPTSTTPTCTTHCTDANLLTMAQNQAAVARSNGISISTIYYTGNTAAGSQASYAASLASLVGGTGVAMLAPTAGSISGVFAGYCATMASSVKTIM